MPVKLIAALAACLAFGGVVQAQTMVEYSNLSNQTVTAVSKSLTKPNPAPLGTVTQPAGATQTVVWEERTPGKNYVPAKPAPPAVFILANGDRLESNSYVLTVNSVRVKQNDEQRTIPLSAINLKATLAANQERGVDL